MWLEAYRSMPLGSRFQLAFLSVYFPFMVLVYSLILGFQWWLLVWAGLLLWIVPSSWKFEFRTHGQRIAARLTSQAICSACGYHLRGISPEEDGCTVCPECNAAWRVTTVAAKGSPWRRDEFGRYWRGVGEGMEPARSNVEVVDDRGNKVPLFPHVVVDMSLLGSFVGATVKKMTARTRMIAGVLGIVAVVCVFAIVRMAFFGLVDSQYSDRWRAGMLIPIGTLGVSLWAWQCMGTQRGQLRALKLAAKGKCPACLGDLKPIEREADGCRVCTDCRSAWR